MGNDGMNWMINMMACVLLTSAAGALLFIFWYAIGRLLELFGFVNIVYEALKAVLIFWFVPIVFPVLLWGNYRHDDRWWGGFLFKYTPTLKIAGAVFCVLWFVGAVCFLARYLMDNRSLAVRYRTAVPISENGWDCFVAACEELHLDPERLEVLESCDERIPRIYGLRKPTIVLPMAEYEDEEYRTMYIHELTHYKHRTLWIKHLTEVALALNFFNPFVWIFDRKVQEWDETACDYDTIKHIGSVNAYYKVLLKMAMGGPKTSSLQANLVERKCDLEIRIQRIKRSYKIMNTKKTVTAVLTVAAMVTASTVSVAAATLAAGNVYMGLYNASVEETQLAGIDDLGNQDLVLQHADALEAGFMETEGEVIELDEAPYLNDTYFSTRSGSLFSWDISKKGSVCTPDFSVQEGHTITITVTSSPSSANIHAGIIKPDGSRDYVLGHGTFMYSFTNLPAGDYAVYVQNKSGVSIHVDGSYYTSAPSSSSASGN